MNYEDTDIRQIIQSVVVIMYLKAKMRKISLIEEIDSSIPQIIKTDGRRIKQILINLIGNAMKFTFRGFIKIIAQPDFYKGKRGVKIIIQDTGVGIKKNDISKLFEMFQILENTQKMNRHGFGLGLTISSNFSKLLTYKGG